MRERLLASLDASDSAVTLLRAPSGYGKTTLVRSWTERVSQESVVLWVTIGASHVSRTSFWEYVAGVAYRSGLMDEGQHGDIIALLNAPDDGKRDLLFFLRDVPPPIIVLDGYERLGALAPTIDEDILHAANSLPGIRIVVTARGRTALHAEALELSGRVRLISEIDLEFTRREVQELFDLVVKESDIATAADISDATGGYAIAVRAAVLELTRDRMRALRWRENALNAINLSAQIPTPELAQFAKITSVVPYFDIELAKKLAPEVDPEAAIQALENEGFGRFIPFSRTHSAFQYVSALREALLEELHTESEEDYRCAASTASRWLSENGDLEGAFSLAIGAHDYSLASYICSKLLHVVVEGRVTDRLAGDLRDLPHEVLVANPVLALGLALARLSNPLTRAEAKPLLVIAANMRPESDSDDSWRCKVVTLQSFALRLLGRFTESATAAREALRLAGEAAKNEIGGESPISSAALRNLAFSLLLVGETARASELVTRTLVSRQSRASLNFSYSYLAGFQAMEGNMGAASVALERVEDAAPTVVRAQKHLDTFGSIARSYIHLERSEWQEANDAIAPFEEQPVAANAWSFMLEPVMFARLAQGEALAEARRVEEILAGPLAPAGAGHSAGHVRVTSMLVVLWLASGRPARARRLLEDYEIDHLGVMPARAIFALMDGDHDRSMQFVSRVLDAARGPRVRMAMHLIGAAGMLRAGDEDASLSMLGHATQLSTAYDLITPLLLLADKDRKGLLRLAIERGETSVAEMIGRLKVESPMSEIAELPQFTERERVVVHALARHASSADIAEELFVSANTVKSQLRSAYKKLGVHSRAEALRRAEALGLLRDPLDR